MRYHFTQQDYNSLADEISRRGTGEHKLYITAEDGSEYRFAVEAYWDSYQEDDYYNGTGQWISSNVEASVALVSAIDAEGEKIIFTDTDFDEDTAVETIRDRIEDI